MRWVIVSDGSTDRTDEIVRGYERRYDWIRLLRMPEQRDRSFAAKVQCFNAGFATVQDLSFAIIGNLDADISFDADYFGFLMTRFVANERLGVAGTPFVESGRHYDYRFTNIEHVSGACQLFRRECFAQIGGYTPVAGGGIDWIAVTAARMKGWQTRTFTEKVCFHHRPIGTGSGGVLQSSFRQGLKDYCLGGHPLWQVFRSAYQVTRPPFLIGGVLLLTGYAWASLCRNKRTVSPALMQFSRAEQMARLRRLFHRGPLPVPHDQYAR